MRTVHETRGSAPSSLTDLSEKNTTKYDVKEHEKTADDIALEHLEEELLQYGVDEAHFEQVKQLADGYSLEDVRERVIKTIQIHENDPNFRHDLIEKFKQFLEDDVFEHPERHDVFLREIRIEIALISYNSPYAEVRAVVANVDDPSTPSSTVRAWVIGLGFSVLLAFVNQLFSIRQPAIHVGAHVAQILAYPLGVTAARVLPDWGVRIWGGQRISLNPGPFSKKEHMLITIMASVGGSIPFTTLIVWTQYLPQFFNQAYAGSFAYQILVGLGTNFIGYGLAGVCRRFLVYPSYCVWPTSLVTIALNSAFHGESGPTAGQHAFASASKTGGSSLLARMSRLRFFFTAFGLMFAYFWLPNILFQALSIFNWLSWIAPNNVRLNSVVGFNNGLGLNPLPTFDWNNILFGGADPLMLPFFTTFNKFAGQFVSLFVILGLWYGNAFSSAYLPLNSNRVFDHFGQLYNVSRAIDSRGLFAAEQYEAYSPAFLTAGNINIHIFSFAIYTATLAYALLYQWHEIRLGFIEVVNSFRPSRARDMSRFEDVHNRLMAAYKEVPEWWFVAILALAIACGIAGVAFWPTFTSPGVVFYGIGLCVLFIVPIGVIKAMTGIEVSLGILAEFIGGSLVPGNQLAMNYMKAYGMITASHALWFANDLKMAHYVKTFAVQMVATLVSTFVCTAVLNFQMNQIPGVCTMDAPNRFTCPYVNSFFTASVLWGTIGPRKIFGVSGQYSLLLLGFPLGLVLAVGSWAIKRRFMRRCPWLRQLHPIVLLSGAIHWAPYNMSYIWPAVPLAYLSWHVVKRRWLGLWSRFNYVLSSALSSGIAVSGLVIFFAIQWPNIQIRWWGNTVSYRGCESRLDPCRLRHLAPGEYFGPRVGEFH